MKEILIRPPQQVDLEIFLPDIQFHGLINLLDPGIQSDCTLLAPAFNDQADFATIRDDNGTNGEVVTGNGSDDDENSRDEQS